MIPSERIKEICNNEKCWSNLPLAIIYYLDEQYEKNKPCEHKDLEDFRGMEACKDCGAVGYLSAKE